MCRDIWKVTVHVQPAVDTIVCAMAPCAPPFRSTQCEPANWQLVCAGAVPTSTLPVVTFHPVDPEMKLFANTVVNGEFCGAPSKFPFTSGATCAADGTATIRPTTRAAAIATKPVIGERRDTRRLSLVCLCIEVPHEGDLRAGNGTGFNDLV